MSFASPNPMGFTVRAVALIGVAAGTAACANEPLSTRSNLGGPMLILQGATPPATAVSTAADRVTDISHKSMAAKVLASRALEAVTGLKADPARLSEHD